MNQRITVCIDCDEENVLELERALAVLQRRYAPEIKNWDVAVDKIKEDEQEEG